MCPLNWENIQYSILGIYEHLLFLWAPWQDCILQAARPHQKKRLYSSSVQAVYYSLCLCLLLPLVDVVIMMRAKEEVKKHSKRVTKSLYTMPPDFSGGGRRLVVG